MYRILCDQVTKGLIDTQETFQKATSVRSYQVTNVTLCMLVIIGDILHCIVLYCNVSYVMGLPKEYPTHNTFNLSPSIALFKSYW